MSTERKDTQDSNHRKNERIVFATSNSWRRFEYETGGTFCSPVVQYDGHPDLSVRERDGERMAACWNACAGMSTEALEAGALARVLEAAGDRIAVRHNGACEYERAPHYTCTCGHDALGEALEALGKDPSRE